MREDITMFVDHSDEILAEMKEAMLRALERCGFQAEGYAKDLVPSPGKTGTGALRNSITHKVIPDELTAYIGSILEYAAYVELGTGIYYPGGRQEPWAYQDEKGNWYMTRGQKAKPYLKPAVVNHKQTYINIINDELSSVKGK